MTRGTGTSEFWAKIASIGVMIGNSVFGWGIDPIEISTMFGMVMSYIAARTWAKSKKGGK